MIKRAINNLSKSEKITYSVFAILIIIMLSIAIPTLTRLVNSSGIPDMDVWDGNIATAYHSGSGTHLDPYIISNGDELAYFSSQLESNNYQNTYFALEGNIILNEGIFDYDTTNGIMYILNDVRYYVSPFTNNYYATSTRTGSPVGQINVFPTLPNFKGNFDGNSYTIYGIYITNSTAYELGLFTNLEGTIENLLIANGMIYGGTVTGGLASKATNSTIQNVLYDGYVVGTGLETSKTFVLNPPNMTFIMSPTDPYPTYYIDVLNTIPFMGGQVTNSTISGMFNPKQGPAGQMTLSVNDIVIQTGNSAAAFGPVTLGTNVRDVPVTGNIKNNNGQIELTNMTYTIIFDYAATGGVVGHSNNTNIVNAINKGSIHSRLTAGGIAGTATGSLNISQSYNNGIIRGTYSGGGLVGIIDKSSGTNISKSYNTGAIAPTTINSGGIVGTMFNNSGAINFNNTFNTSNNYCLGTVLYSTVNVTDSYRVYDSHIGSGNINGQFVKISSQELQAKDILMNMGFKEFISEDDLLENPEHVWVYVDNDYPLLYSDTKVKPTANIFAGISVYSKYNDNLDIKPIDNPTFIVEAANLFHPVREKYYYIMEYDIELDEPLSLQDLDNLNWEVYDNIIQIATEGYYIIYSKVIDYNDEVTYLNTDILLLDMTAPTVNVNLSSTTWNDLRNNLNNITVTTLDVIEIETEDQLTGIESIKYYMTDAILSSSELNNLNEGLWMDYEDGISLVNGTYIVYVRVDDVAGNVTYVNTDIINLSSYDYNNFTLGYNMNYEEDIYITDKSMITFNTNYNASTFMNGGSYTHNLISNILLPMGTKITFIDHINARVYQYEITTNTDIYNYNDSCDNLDCVKVATYPFTLFKEIGTINNTMFTESDYFSNGVVNENFTIIVDFIDTNMSTDYNDVMLYMELQDTIGASVRTTPYESVKAFNIYSNGNSKATLSLTSNYDGSTILLNSDSSTDINLISKLTYKQIDGTNIIDTTYEGKVMGLTVKLTDSNGNIINGQHLKSMVFKIGDDNYYPGSDDIIHIPLNNGGNVTLTVVTCDGCSNLSEGTYYLKISNIISYDGYYALESGEDEIVIPVTVSDNEIISTYSFDVTMNNYIISKANEEVEITFNILKRGDFDNPNVRVSLYEKDRLTAYNQDYNIVDLDDYTNNTISQYSSYVYYASISTNESTTFKLNFITESLSNTGYRLVFELYDGNKKIGTIKKYFIVR